MAVKLKALVATATTSPAPLSSTPLVVPVGSIVSVDSSGVVYIGDSSLTGATDGFKLPNTPLALGAFENKADSDSIDLNQVYFVGGSGNEKVRILYPHKYKMV